VRMSGPVANLLSVEASRSVSAEFSFDDLAAAAEIALEELLHAEEAARDTPLNTCFFLLARRRGMVLDTCYPLGKASRIGRVE